MPDRILFVDDDPKILKSFARMFSGRYDFETANSGKEGLRLIKEKGPFAIIVSDIKMPEMDGLEFLSLARERDPDGVRMILTGYADLENAMDAVNSGYIFRFLTKPCSQECLEGALESGLEQHRLLQARTEMASVRRIKDAMEGIVAGFIHLVEARDPYTAGHQRSVTTLSLAIAKDMGLDEDRLLGLRLAASVHDIGKVYVPAEFLNRPGRLSAEEFAIIKTHPKVGYDILSPVDFPWPVARMVYQHHERLNGTGYPEGVAGEDILLEARIMAVADVIDAISSHRPYRPGRGLEIALEEIQSKAGEIYDPKVVSICLELLKSGRYSLDLNGDPAPYCG